MSEYIPGQNVSKITEHLASIRFDREAFFKGVKEAGFTKANGAVDLKAFERHLNRKGLSMWKMKSQKMMNSVTNELNDMLGGKFYKNVKKYSQKSILENLASKFKGFRGKYAEMYSAFTKEKFWDDALNLQEKGDKKFGTKKAKEKLLWIARQLKTKWPSIGIGTTVSALSKYGFGKTLPVVGHLITTKMGSGELPKEGTQEYEELIQGLNKEDEKGLEVTVPLPYTQEKAPTERFNKGGMMDIDYMTRPLGYANGGFEDRMSMLRESMMDTENQRMREPDITSVAMTIAQQEGDTSEENINLIIRQLEALMPSLTKTMEKELTPMSTQGIKYLFDKMNVATGRKSDPRLNRSVGFGRVE